MQFRARLLMCHCLQRNALGESVKVTAAWEGAVHKASMLGSAKGRHTTWRYMDAGLMVVRTAVLLDKGRETSMFWYLEAIDEPEHNPTALHGIFPHALSDTSLPTSGRWAPAPS